MAAPVILSDTGPLVALFNRKDKDHAWTRSRFGEFAEALITSEPVMTETLYLLRRLPEAARRLLSLWERGGLVLSFSAELEKPALIHLMQRYANVPISFADASLIRLSEIHSACKVWTLDADFFVYRRHGRQAIPLITPA